MKLNIYEIGMFDVVISLIPIIFVIGILAIWSLNSITAIYASLRMLIQLIVIGYILASIFALNDPNVVVLILVLMLLIASWITLRPLKEKNSNLFLKALIAITIGGVLTLIFTTLVVLKIDYWYQPEYVIPLAGMIFSNAMNTVSLAAERFESDLLSGSSYEDARNRAFTASLIPLINTFFAVGLVALPGMMTGQILSGVSPLIAAKYQIVIMSVLFGSSGISAAIFLLLQKNAYSHASS